MYLIEDYHNHQERHNNSCSSSFRSRVTAYCVSAVDSRRAMLDLSSNMASNRKMDGLGGIDTKLGYLALLDPKL